MMRRNRERGARDDLVRLCPHSPAASHSHLATRSESNRLGLVRGIAFIAAVLCVSLPLVAMEPAYGQDDDNDDCMIEGGPDFAGVGDALNGQRILSDIADLVVSAAAPDGSMIHPRGTIFLTDEGKIVSTATANASAVNCHPVGVATDTPFPQNGRTGRVFDLPNDVLVTITPTTDAMGANCDGASNMELRIIDQLDGSHDTFHHFTLSSPSWLMATMGDFDFDGFDDLFVIDATRVFVMTALDVNDPGKGMHAPFGYQAHGLASSRTPRFEPAVGDFNGDGLRDVAWIGATPLASSSDFISTLTVSFLTVCPDAVTGTVCDGRQPFEAVISAQTIVLDINSTGLGAPTPCSWAAALAAGNYDTSSQGNSPRQLAVGAFFQQGQGSALCHANVTIYDFAADFTATERATTTVLTDSQGGGMLLDATRFDWSGSTDQLAYAIEIHGPTERVGVMTFVTDDSVTPPKLTMTPHTTSVGNDDRTYGMATGVFGPPAGGLQTTADYTPQIALLTYSHSKNRGYVTMYTVDAAGNNYAPRHGNSFEMDGLGEITDSTGPSNGSVLRAGDLQGRGQRLGEPLVARVPNHWQPTLIIGHPPMHVDYIEARNQESCQEDDDGGPTVVNFTVTPEDYNTVYNLSTSSASSGSRETTTSFSYAFTESTEERIKLGAVPLVGGVDADFKQTWGQSYDSTKSKSDYQYSSSSFDLTEGTGFGDELFKSVHDLSVYTYPVIGQTTCPEDNADCSDDERVPLTVQFSGPDQVCHISVNGVSAEWYQPVHEPGQILSYPWSDQQLAARVSNSASLTMEDMFWFTDDSPDIAHASWTGQTTDTRTSGTTQTHSFDTTNTVTAGTPNLDEAFGGVNVTASFEYNSSSSLSTLNTETTEVDESSGVQVNKPGRFRCSDEFAYAFAPRILGKKPPLADGTAQGNLITSSVDVSAYGPFQTAFLADPTLSEAGNFWQRTSNPYKCHMDVAVNHPQRWVSVESSANWPLTCITTSTTNPDCVEFDWPDPTDPWKDEFYAMRGLLVTVGDTTGPQRVSAVEGEQVTLQARVYNYSLMDTDIVQNSSCTSSTRDPNAKVKVRFYRQEVQSVDVGQPVSGTSSVLIEEVSLSPIPRFKSSTGPNYSVATTTFDTTGMGDSYHVFWVLAWAEDADGSMLTELPAHGLSKHPREVAIGWIDDVPLETVDLSALPDPPSHASFSNNVGMLMQTFYVQPADGTSAGSGAGTMLETIRGSTRSPLVVDNVRLTPPNPKVGERVVLSADVRSTEGPADGLAVSFFEEEPRSFARAFDVEIVPYIRANEIYRVKVPFRPRRAGLHELRVVAEYGRRREGRAHLTVEVEQQATPTASPTPTLPLPGEDSDSCAIGAHGAGPGTGSWLLWVVPLWLIARRRQSRPR